MAATPRTGDEVTELFQFLNTFPLPARFALTCLALLLALARTLLKIYEVRAHKQTELDKAERLRLLANMAPDAAPALAALPAPAEPPRSNPFGLLLVLILAAGTLAWSALGAQEQYARQRAQDDETAAAGPVGKECTRDSDCPSGCKCDRGCKCPSRAPRQHKISFDVPMTLDARMGDWGNTSVLAASFQPFPERR